MTVCTGALSCDLPFDERDMEHAAAVLPIRTTTMQRLIKFTAVFCTMCIDWIRAQAIVSVPMIGLICGKQSINQRAPVFCSPELHGVSRSDHFEQKERRSCDFTRVLQWVESVNLRPYPLPPKN